MSDTRRRTATPARTVLGLAWRDLRGSGAHLWVFWCCLMLGVMLVAGTGGLFRQVSTGLLADTRALFGGDVEVESRRPLEPEVLDWMRERGDVSLLIELRTMLFAGDRPQLVELQSVDDRYPLYGTVELVPPMSVAAAVEPRDGTFGTAIDPVLARRLGLAPGDRVEIGNLDLEIRALVARQPDRSLRADWSGPPVLVSADALAPSGLVGPGSRLEYEYRVRVPGDALAWAEAIGRAFPEAEFEVGTFHARETRMTEVLGQVASGLLLVGLAALFVGGLGVFNSVRAYLDGKLATIATLRALGLRERALAGVYLSQVLALAGSASLAGALAGGALALAATQVAAERLPVAPSLAPLAAPLAVAWLFGVLTALTFALPAVGRALAVQPAVLFRGLGGGAGDTPPRWWRRSAAAAAATAALVVAALPQPTFGAAFLAATGVLLLLLEAVVRGIRAAAYRLGHHRALDGHFALKLAVANLHRRGSPLRATLLSLGSALTVLVAAVVVVAALLRTIEQTLPARSPALVLYDIGPDQVAPLRELAATAGTLERLDLAPLVLGRISHVDGERLRDSADGSVALESRDEHKLTHRLDNIDDVTVVRGRWWPEDHAGSPLVAFEDREADQLGLEVGDRLTFLVAGREVEAELAAIYSQRGIGTRFWFEGVFSDGSLDAHVTRYVGAAYLDDEEAVALEEAVARAMPNVVMVRTARLLDEARTMLGRAASGLAVIAGVTLLASLLVLASVVATGRARQAYDATVLHTLGARLSVIRTSLSLQQVLVAALTTLFAVTLGSALAGAVLSWRVQVDGDGLWLVGATVAVAVCAASLGLGGRALLRRLRLAPALLLRASG